MKRWLVQTTLTKPDGQRVVKETSYFDTYERAMEFYQARKQMLGWAGFHEYRVSFPKEVLSSELDESEV